MFKSRSEGNVVYKCSIRLLDDSFLELEFQVGPFSSVMYPSNEIINENLGKFSSNFLETEMSEVKSVF